jgi:hypothetical protein
MPYIVAWIHAETLKSLWKRMWGLCLQGWDYGTWWQ